MKKDIDEKVLNIFRIKKVMTKKKLTILLNCTGRTVQRRLRLWQAITSYNKNSQYYTLPEIAKFNRHGIWHYRGIYFSKYGNLNKTVTQLVKTSDAGLTGQELGDILGLNPRSFLSHFRDNAELYREKFNGRFIYYSVGEKQRYRQKDKRHKQEKQFVSRLPTHAEAAMILVELIKHPDWSVAELASSLLKKGIGCDSNAIEQLLIHHELIKKKNCPLSKKS